MTESLKNNAELDCLDSPQAVLTYFNDFRGNIYYSKGAGFLPQTIRANLVYVPEEDGNRVCSATNQRFQKYIFDGRSNNFESLPDQIRGISSYVVGDPITREELLLIPKEKICKIHSPYGSLQRILIEDSNLGEVLRSFVLAMESLGIGKNDLGLHGGLQAGIVKPGGDVHDVDISIYGLDHTPKIFSEESEQIISEYGFGRIAFPQNGDPIKNHKAKKMSLYYPTRQGDLGEIDIKFIRQKKDRFSWQIPEERGQEVVLTGKVIDDDEGPTIPAIYQLETDSGIVQVQSYTFKLAGAAWKGDRIRVRGILASNILTVPTEQDFQYV